MDNSKLTLAEARDAMMAEALAGTPALPPSLLIPQPPKSARPIQVSPSSSIRKHPSFSAEQPPQQAHSGECPTRLPASTNTSNQSPLLFGTASASTGAFCSSQHPNKMVKPGAGAAAVAASDHADDVCAAVHRLREAAAEVAQLMARIQQPQKEFAAPGEAEKAALELEIAQSLVQRYPEWLADDLKTSYRALELRDTAAQWRMLRTKANSGEEAIFSFEGSTIFNLKFTAKQLSKSAVKCEKEEKSEKLKIKKAIEKGNVEGAKIYAQNAGS
eukprot:gene28584-31753_t